ncbi:MAG TPA: ATP-binding protein [Vicinamibacterales bacterium]|nr:ATP-binding protein [Vicinamibacterales bacterium]
MTTRRAIQIAALTMLVAIAAGAIVGTWNILRVHAAADRVARASEVKSRLAELQQHLADAETGQRGFLLTGEELYLWPYHEALAQIASTLDRIQSLSDPGGTTGRGLPHLRYLVAIKLQELERTVGVRRTQGGDAARAIVLTDVGREEMAAIRSDLQTLTAEQEKVVEAEAFASRRSERVAILSEIATAIASVLLLAFGVHRSNRLLAAQEARERMTRELLEATEDAARARAELLERERELNRVKDQFLATLSHELRTPMNAVLGWVRMLRSGVVEQHRVQDALQAVERNATIQHRMIEDLLDLSRVVAGKFRLELTEVNPAEIAEAALSAVQPAAATKGIQLDVALDDDLPRLHADPRRLQQVIWNLLANAIKFTGPGGHVRLDVRRSDRDVIVEVHDDGAGISRESLPHVWERFHQADGASQGGSDAGLGLGLAIVRHIVELHGGTAMAESPGRGGGSTFRIVLPAADAEAGASRPRQRRSGRGASSS